MIKVKQAAQSLCVILGLAASAGAAELLDVKPVVSGSSVEVQVTADIPMTYTFYKVPGQARAVVDIADADPEKVEPLIVVNKGIVSSISVDKAQLDGMIVSRIIFNLASESDINVQATADRKSLAVTFGSAGATAPPVKVVEPVASPASPAALPEAASAAKNAPVEAKTESKPKEEDPLGLDEPAASVAQKPQTTAAGVSEGVRSEAATSAVAAPPARTDKKIEPVVPVLPSDKGIAAPVVKGIVVTGSYIDVQANGRIENYKVIKLVNPVRLAIDIPSAKSSMTSRSIPVGRLGIEKVRVGINAGSVRVVLDSTKSVFPKYSISGTANGFRISFN